MARVRDIDGQPRSEVRLHRLRLGIAVGFPLLSLGVLALVLSSDGWAINRLNVRVWLALGMHRFMTPEDFAALANAVMFVPLGFCLAIARPSWLWVPLLAATSVAIEVVQETFLSDRAPELIDILANSCGAMIGVSAGMLLVRKIRDADVVGKPELPGAAHHDPAARATQCESLEGSARGPSARRGDRD